jgi:CRISPR-associated Csx10 family RAMP protein
MRYTLRIRLHNLEPLVLGDEPEAGNVVRTALYIPGGALLGFFANDYLRGENGNPDGTFRRWFLDARTRFQNLYPALHESASECYASAPLPLSTFTCKRYPGRYRGRMAEEHLVSDCLLRNIPMACPQDSCGAEMKAVEGLLYYRPEDDEFYRLEPRIRVNMHNMIDDERQRPPEPGGLFSFECLEEEQFFEGQIAFDSTESKESFRELFADVLHGERKVYLGRAKRRHYGCAELELMDEVDESLAEILLRPPFEERWAAFSDQKELGRGGFTVTLYSDAILCDRALRHATSLTENLFALETGLEAEKLKLNRRFSSHRRVGGFSAVHGLPKEFDIAVSKGSAFHFSYQGDQDKLREALRKAEESGIGFRTNEGFGTIIVNDPYHLRGNGGTGE